jgi:hypothetical protein
MYEDERPIIMATIGDENYDICELSTDRPIREILGNARLIAAAPELLDECRMILQDARDALSGEWVPTAEGWQSIIEHRERLIAKVEGRL